VYEETLTGRPHDKSVQKAISDNENVERHAITFNIMPWTSLGVGAV